MSKRAKLSKEFGDGWLHFCKCINFGNSFLDGEAIQFMNEMPSKVVLVLERCESLLETLKEIQIDATEKMECDPKFLLALITEIATEAIAKAEK